MQHPPRYRRPLRAVKLCALSVLIASFTFSLAMPERATARVYLMQGSGAKDSRPRIEIVPGELLVRYRAESLARNHEQAGAPLRVAGGDEVSLVLEKPRGFEIVEGLRHVLVSPERTLQTIAAFKTRPDVLYAEPVYKRRADVLPNDPSFGQLYGLKRIAADQAWSVNTGSKSIVVGVIDEGIDVSHEDLAGNIWVNPGEIAGNGIDDDNNGFVDDVNGYDFVDNKGTVFSGQASESHASHVAGTIGAVGNNGIGVTGVNWQVSLMSLKVLGPNGGSDADIIRAYGYAKMMRNLWDTSGGKKGANIRVLNNSYGGGGFSQAGLDAIRALNDAGILFVAAAGNDGSDTDKFPHYPSSYQSPNIISVAATDRSDNLASFSNYGPHSVDIAAPGVGILSTTPANTYSSFSGTSMATPHVAGAAALICAQYPGISVRTLRSVLVFNGDAPSPLSTQTLTGLRLNLNTDLQVLATGDVIPPGTVKNFAILSQTGQSIDLGWIASGDDGDTGLASLYAIEFTDQSTGKQLPLAKVRPAAPGTLQSVTIGIPFRHSAGIIRLREFDKVGNEGAPASVTVSIDPALSDPYVTSLGAAAALSTGGTALGIPFDDRYQENYPLPFSFPFFGHPQSAVTVSTNGSLYFSTPPKRSNGDADDAQSSVYGLGTMTMIAGLWDDLTEETKYRPDGDVYVVNPDSNRIIFRWQGVPCHDLGKGCTGGDPVNFEVELRSDGTILSRYGNGNTAVQPVVGISGGQPEGYVIDSLTSESQPINLTNALTVTYSPRSIADLSNASNPIDGAQFFVSQHYRDFLNRDPDSAGLQYWTEQITGNSSNNPASCTAGDSACVNSRRIGVSAAFFIELEFQQTGNYVYGLYKGALGRQPKFSEFMVDRGMLHAGPTLDVDKQNLAAAFVGKNEFKAIYQGLDNSGYVNKLYDTAGLTQSTTERMAAINGLNNGTKTRTNVLTEMIANVAFTTREYNPSFVMMQYFGYLRRDYDQAGYDFWLNVVNNKLTNDPSGYRAMVCAFITSAEYQLRFGSTVSRTNRDCG